MKQPINYARPFPYRRRIGFAEVAMWLIVTGYCAVLLGLVGILTLARFFSD